MRTTLLERFGITRRRRVAAGLDDLYAVKRSIHLRCVHHDVYNAAHEHRNCNSAIEKNPRSGNRSLVIAVGQCDATVQRCSFVPEVEKKLWVVFGGQSRDRKLEIR